MPTLIEQEPALAAEIPPFTFLAADHAHEAALLKSLEAILLRLGQLERETILIAVQLDLETDRAEAERLTTLRPDDPPS